MPNKAFLSFGEHDDPPTVMQRRRVFDKFLRWLSIQEDSKRKFGLLLSELYAVKFEDFTIERRAVQALLIKQTLVAIHDYSTTSFEIRDKIEEVVEGSAEDNIPAVVMRDYLTQPNIIHSWRYEVDDVVRSAARLSVMCNYIKFHVKASDVTAIVTVDTSDRISRFLNIVNKLDNEDTVQYLLLRVCTILILETEHGKLIPSTLYKRQLIPNSCIKIATEQLRQSLA